MISEYTFIKGLFHHDVVEGSHYDVGKQQGELLLKSNAETIKWFPKKELTTQQLGFKNFLDLQAFYEELCPGITEEFRGFADALGLQHEEFMLYSPPIFHPGNCSQIALLSPITSDSHVYVARSYEFFHKEDDCRLITTRIQGKPKTIGFSNFVLGRSDGINEYGFCITFTGGGTFKREPINRGFAFFLITRTLLDNCRDVKEAINRIEKIPVHGYWNFLMTDKQSNAALVQFFDGEYAIRQIDINSTKKYLYSCNHYLLPEMVKYQKFAGDWILKNSIKRSKLIQKTLSQAKSKINKEMIRELLSKEIYDGLCGHYYNDYFGTLFSVIFDLTELNAEICFGAPTHNQWRKPFGFDDPIGSYEYQAIFPNKSIKTDSLFTK